MKTAVSSREETSVFVSKRQIIELLLDVGGKLNLEDGERVLYLSCALGKGARFFVSSIICYGEHNSQDILIVSSRILIRKQLAQEFFSYGLSMAEKQTL